MHCWSKAAETGGFGADWLGPPHRRLVLWVPLRVGWGFPGGPVVAKNPPAKAGDARDVGSIPGSGRPRGGGHGNPLQYSCLENPMDREACQSPAHGVTRNLSWLFSEGKRDAFVERHPICLPRQLTTDEEAATEKPWRGSWPPGPHMVLYTPARLLQDHERQQQDTWAAFLLTSNVAFRTKKGRGSALSGRTRPGPLTAADHPPGLPNLASKGA